MTISATSDFGRTDKAFFVDGFLTDDDDDGGGGTSSENIKFSFVDVNDVVVLSLEMDPDHGKILVETPLNTVGGAASNVILTRWLFLDRVRSIIRFSGTWSGIFGGPGFP